MSGEPSSIEEVKIGALVALTTEAMGYPMLEDPREYLGVGLVIALERREKETIGIEMVQVLWTKTGKKRWEFLDDLRVVDPTY